MMKKYPLTEELEQTIGRIYPDEDTGRLAIGVIGVSLAAREPVADPATPYKDRVQELRKKLEGWVQLYADQLEEFEGEQDIVRLRSEARSILLALRELHRLFPEVIT